MEELEIHVLFIEDDPGDAKRIQELLAGSQPAGHCFVVVHGSTLAAGLAQLDQGGVDVVLLDSMLPEGRVQPHLGEIRRRAPNVPILILSDQDDETLAIRAIRAGAQDCLAKQSLTQASLRRAILHATERNKAVPAAPASGQLLENTFNAIQDGISILDDQLTVLRVNHAMERWYPHAVPLEGKKCHEVYHGRAEICDPCPSKRALETESHQMDIVPLTGPRGVEGWLELHAFPMLDASGRAVGIIEYVHNITDRKRAEDALQESEARYRTLFHQANDAIFLERQDQQIIDVNQQAVTLTGYSRAELLMMRTTDLQPPDVQVCPPFPIYTEQDAAGGNHFRTRIAHRNGGEIPVEVSIARLSAGEQQYFLSTVRDITERAAAEAEREQWYAREREQRLLAETLREVTLALTSQLSYQAVLDEVLRQVQRVVPFRTANIALLDGSQLDVVRGLGPRAVGTDSKGFIASLKQRLESLPLDLRVVQNNTPLVIPDTAKEPLWYEEEHTSWIRSHISMPICLREEILGLLRLDSDVPAGFSKADIERLRPLVNAAAIAIENARLVDGLEAEVSSRTAEILAERDKSAAILRSVGDAIIVIDVDMRVQFANETFTRLTGYTREEVLGEPMFLWLSGQITTQDQQALRQVLQTGEVWRGEVTIQRRDGRQYAAAMSIAPLHDAERKMIGGVSSHQDITSLKNLERARQRFMTNISHELRTPITNLKLYASLLQQPLPPDKIQHYLKVIEDQTIRLSDLVVDILEMTNLDSGQVIQSWETFPTAFLINDLVARFESQAEESGLAFSVGPIPEDLPAVKGDRIRLTQAVGELLENAINFTQASGNGERSLPGLVSLQASAQQDSGRWWVVITVSDTGPGMSEGEVDRIFERFYRGSQAEAGHIPGTGLGLSMAQAIVRAHGGRIDAHSTPGKGSTFTVWLPIEPR